MVSPPFSHPRLVRLLVLAALVIITSSAPAAALAEERAPRRLARLGGVVAAALAEPPSDRADIAPASCPYHFGSDMPAATFCVYRGAAFGGDGEVCATDVAVIWSSFVPPRSAVGLGHAENPSGSGKEVYIGFAADPELVIRAIVDDPGQGDRAEMVGYALGSEEAPQPLAGSMTLRALRLGSADVLGMELREARRFQGESCAFTSYSGTFVGMIGPPSDTTPYVEAFLAPWQ